MSSVSLSEGSQIRAELTGKTYTVSSVDEEELRVKELPNPVDRDEVKEDIDAGRLAVID